MIWLEGLRTADVLQTQIKVIGKPIFNGGADTQLSTGDHLQYGLSQDVSGRMADTIKMRLFVLIGIYGQDH